MFKKQQVLLILNSLLAFLFLFYCSQVASAKNFKDVSASNPYYKSIQTLTKEKVISGYVDGNFLSGKVINRAEFLKIAIEAMQSNQDDTWQEDNFYTNCFQDVEDEWFAKYVCYAKNQGWVKGYIDDSFRPSNPITFAEVLTILGKIYALDISSFDSENWYYPYQRYFEIFDLIPNIQQSMDFQINRGEMAEIICRLQEHLKKTKSTEIKQKIKAQKKLEDFKLEVFKMVNAERAKVGSQALIYNIQLEKAAQMHAQDMIDRDFFAHVNPDGVDVMIRVKKFKYDQRDAGENIAFGQRDPTEVMHDWMNSAPHRKNLLKANYTEMGVGLAVTADGILSWVQVFGKQCSERDNRIGCISRSEFQKRNEGKWVSPYKWYD